MGHGADRLGRIAAAIVGARRWILVGAAVLTAVALARIGALDSDFTLEDLFADVGDQRRITGELRAVFGNTDNSLVAVVAAADVGAPAALGYIGDLDRAARRIEEIDRVDSIASIRLTDRSGAAVAYPEHPDAAEAAAIATAAASSPLINGRLIAADRSVAVVVMTLGREHTSSTRIETAVGSVEELIAGLPRPDGASVSLGGLPYVRATVVRNMKSDQARLLPIGFGLCLIILFIAFRWVYAVVFPLLAVGVSVALVVGSMAWLGLQINVVNNVVPLLILIIGISDSIHLIGRYGEELAAGRDAADACRAATRRMLVACFLTSFTTAVGFGSLLSSSTQILRGFGALAAAGVLVAFVVTISFLPAALGSVGPPRRPLSGRSSRLRLGALAGPLARRAPLVIAAFAIAAAIAGWICRDLEVDEGVRRQFDRDTEIARTMEILETRLEGVRPVEVFVSSNRRDRLAATDALRALDAIAGWAETQPEVLSVVGLPDLVREVRFVTSGGGVARDAPLSGGDLSSLARLIPLSPDDGWRAFVDREFCHARISLSLRDVGSRATLALVDRLREVAEAELAQLESVDAAITGEGYASSLGLEALIRDLAWSLAIAVAGIFAFLALIFRSARFGLLSLPTNVLPLLFGFAYMTIRGIPLATATVIVASVALGLAVDGTIHVIARYREEIAGGGDGQGALERALDGTGRAVVATCLTLIAGFGILGASSFVPVRQFGELIAVNIAACLVCQIFLLPPLLHLAAPRQWQE